MRTFRNELREALAYNVTVSDDALVVDLEDGRTITTPLAWFPRLAHGSLLERGNWRLIAGGEGIHWPDLDEDISVEALLAGRRSGETHESLHQWSSCKCLAESKGKNINPNHLSPLNKVDSGCNASCHGTNGRPMICG